MHQSVKAILRQAWGLVDVKLANARLERQASPLETNHPGMKDRLCDDKGVRRFVNIYANDEDIRFLDNLETVLKEGDTLSIVPAIAGGASL